MSRSLRWALNFAAAASALLFVVMCVLWFWSKSSEIRWPVSPGHAVVCYAGRVGISNDPECDGASRTLYDLSEELGYTGLPASRQMSLELEESLYARRVRPGDGQYEKIKAQIDQLERQRNEARLQYAGLLASRPKRVVRSVRCPAAGSALMLFPAAWLSLGVARRLRGHLRRRGGLCISCGYDLRATSDKCPECGTVPTMAK